MQNRVDPWGRIFATPACGTFMGNRGGVIHNAERQIVRTYKSRQWITCLLEFKGRRRTVMSPGRYTELFFLDEAVALAAGHRPCAECRRARFKAYSEAWTRATGAAPPSAGEMDLALHGARMNARREKVTYTARFDSLPDGCFVAIDNDAYLVWRGELLLWSPAGYLDKRREASKSILTVLTPEPSVRCLANGYEPDIHQSAMLNDSAF